MSSMSFVTNYWNGARSFVLRHKIWSALFAILILIALWWLWSILTSTSGETRYVLGTAVQGTVISTVAESGQVTANQTLNLTPQVSGALTSVDVVPGQQVSAGQTIATIDSTDAQEQVTSAQEDLESAQLSLAKLQEPATTLTLTQQQNAITQAQQSLATQYQSSFSDVTSAFLDLPTIIGALQDIDLGNEAGGALQWNIDYYADQADHYDASAEQYRDAAYNDYEAALASYNQTFTDFKNLSATPDDQTITTIVAETYKTSGLTAAAAKSANDLVQLYSDQISQNSGTPKAVAATQITNLQTYQTKLQSHLTSLLSDQNSLTNDQNNITQAQQTLQQTQAGPDTLDVQQDQLDLQKAQDALDQAEQTLTEYTVTAPFSGTIGSVPVNVYDQAGSGTTVATLITNAQYADLTVNEVDAAKLQLGQKATLTFDAIPDLTLTGTIAEIDTVGTVSQGVVSYDVRISFDTQNPQVKSGMTVNATIQTAVDQNVLTVPSSAVKTQGAISYVQAFNPPLASTTPAASTQGVTTDEMPVDIPITAGISDNTNTEITAGLTAGQQIIVRTTTSGSTPSAAASATNRTTSGFGGGGLGGGGGAALRGGGAAILR